VNQTLASADAGHVWTAPSRRFAPAADLKTYVVVAVTLGGVLYNALLAFLGAHGVPVNKSVVIVTEFLVLAFGASAVLLTGRREHDAAAIALAAFFIADALIISMAAESLFPPMARAAAIIALFLMLGTRASERSIRLSFGIATAAVGAGLLLEILSPSTYIQLLQPGAYYEVTRGAEPLETLPGLFRNASGFEGRFAIFQILDHRAGSLFLEPVSLGNFAVVLLGYLMCLWKRLGRPEKVGYIALIGLILLATNSRILLGFILLTPLIYFGAPTIGRYPRLLVLPGIMLVAALIFALAPQARSDDLAGRIAETMRSLLAIDALGYLGLQPKVAATFTDSGYTYVTYASSILGVVVLWLFISLVLPANSSLQKRLGVFVALYTFSSLLISGNSVFSIKVAALVWLLMGFAAASANSSDDDHLEGWKERDNPQWPGRTNYANW
jgi:putative polymerase